MIKGLYAAASAMLANLTRQSVLAHNAANLNTPGFKQTLASLEEWNTTGVMYPPGNLANAAQLANLGEIGLGVDSSDDQTDYSEGPLQNTGEALDLAINGAGFFRVRTPNGERYTRDGRFSRDAAGTLVTVDGYQVLGTGGAPITLTQDGVIGVGGDGTLTVNGTAAGQLGIAVFADPEAQLRRDLPNAFAATTAPATAGAGTVVQGALEMSNASAASIMTQVGSIARAYEAAQQLVSTQDALLARAMQTLGRL